MKVKSESEAAQSCPSLPGSSIHGIFLGKSNFTMKFIIIIKIIMMIKFIRPMS